MISRSDFLLINKQRGNGSTEFSATVVGSMDAANITHSEYWDLYIVHLKDLSDAVFFEMIFAGTALMRLIHVEMEHEKFSQAPIRLYRKQSLVTPVWLSHLPTKPAIKIKIT